MFRSAAALALCLSTITAQAGEIRIVASGQLYQVGGTLTPSLQIGSPWSLDWTISDDGYDWNQTARIGEYHGLYGTFTLGGRSFDSDFGNAHLDYVTVLDGEPFNGNQDKISARVATDRFNPPAMDGVVVQFSFLNLWGKDLSLFSGDSIANIVGREPSDFMPFSDFRIYVKPPVTSSFALIGDVQSLAITTTTVPVPQAVWLFGSAIGVMGWMRRKFPA